MEQDKIAGAVKLSDSSPYRDIKLTETPLEYGPLRLNPFSQQLSEVINKLLQGKEANFSFSKEKGLEVTIEGKHYNISLLLEIADLNQLLIDPETMKKYPEILKKQVTFQQPVLGDPSRDDFPTEAEFRRLGGESFNELSYAEMLAINIYTTDFYKSMNPFLRGDMSAIAKAADLGQEALNRKATELLLASCLAASGLNKVPDVVSIPEHVVRGDISLPKNILEARVKAAAEGGVMQVDCFTSTSEGDQVPFGERVQTMFYNLVGKRVSSIAGNPEEREFLIPPTQVQWVGVSEGGSGTVYFVGKPVSSPAYAKGAGITAEIIEGHANCQKEVAAILATLKKSLAEVKKTRSIPKKWKQITEYKLKAIEQEVEKLSQELRSIRIYLASSSTIEDKLSEFSKLKAIYAAIVENRIKVLYELQDVISAGNTANIGNRISVMFGFADKRLLERENDLLKGIQEHFDDLIQHPEKFTHEGLETLKSAIIVSIDTHKTLVQEANQRRGIFKLSGSKVDAVLSNALKEVEYLQDTMQTTKSHSL